MTFFRWMSLSVQLMYHRWALDQLCASHPEYPGQMLLVKEIETRRAALGMGAV
jgi:hypothetical protein